MPCLLTFDFECLGDTGWSTFGLLLIEYPSGHIIHALEIGNRSALGSLQRKSQLHFWKTFLQARLYNEQLMRTGLFQTDGEGFIIQSLKALFQAYPNIELICDQPAFDVPILNQMLLRHNRPRVENRNGGQFFQTLCSWSMRLSLLRMLHLSSSELQQRLPTRDFCPLAQRLIHTRSMLHTPLYDCMFKMLEHIRILDFMQQCQVVPPSPALSTTTPPPTPCTPVGLSPSTTTSSHDDKVDGESDQSGTAMPWLVPAPLHFVGLLPRHASHSTLKNDGMGSTTPPLEAWDPQKTFTTVDWPPLTKPP